MEAVQMQTEPTINDLKAQVYDKIGEMENYQRAIQEIQKQIGEINQQIAKKIQEVK